ncbi:MAG: UDP-2,3-diacylglucosamine diphosphatase [Pseudomonadota bacterium]
MTAPATDREKGESRPVLFISDLHLSPERPGGVALFQRFLREVAPQARDLYILGDFVETWVGDDDLGSPFNQALVAELHQLASRGCGLHFLPGNRDFLVGQVFAKAAGLTLIPDPAMLNLFGTPTLLSHGDLFCSDDIAYQAFRTQVRDPDWQTAFLSRPLAERQRLAREMREHSETAKAVKGQDIMDVNPETLRGYLEASGAGRVIHGHTHRPARHTHTVAGGTVERWVLPDWYESGGYLRCDDAGCRALPFPPAPFPLFTAG